MRKSEVIQIGRYQEVEARQFLGCCFKIEKLSSEEAPGEETNFTCYTKSVRLFSKISSSSSVRAAVRPIKAEKKTIQY